MSYLFLGIYTAQDGKCYLCEKEIYLELDKDNLDIDHIKPLHPKFNEPKGEDNEYNLALTHASCNRSKSNNSVELQKAILKIKKIEEEYDCASLKEVLDISGGAKSKLIFNVAGDTFNYKVDGNNYSTKIYTDERSGERTCFIELPVSYIFHDSELNPRPLNASISKLIEEFYFGNPQLHTCLATIKDGKVSIFDGQHKAAAQLALGVKKLLVRIFIEPDLQRLNKTNVRAGKELCQIAFSKATLTQLNYNVYQDKIKLYQQAHNLEEDNYDFSEQQLYSYFGDKSVSSIIIDALKWDITNNKENRLTAFIDQKGKGTGVGKTAPLSYSAFSKGFLNVLIDSSKLFSQNLDKSPRLLESQQLIRLCNIIADNICIGNYDENLEVTKIEDKIQKEQDSMITDNHLRCCRLLKEDIFSAMVFFIQEIIEEHFKQVEMNPLKGNDKKNFFTYVLDENLWLKIENFVKNFSDLQLWVWRKSNANSSLFGKKSKNSWLEALLSGSMDGVTILAKPIRISDMIM